MHFWMAVLIRRGTWHALMSSKHLYFESLSLYFSWEIRRDFFSNNLPIYQNICWSMYEYDIMTDTWIHATSQTPPSKCMNFTLVIISHLEDLWSQKMPQILRAYLSGITYNHIIIARPGPGYIEAEQSCAGSILR